MYDLIIVKKIRTIRVIFTGIIVAVIISLVTILGMNKAQKEYNEKYAEELEKQRAEAIENEKNNEEIRNAKIKNEHIEKTSKPLTEEQQYNILHIYNDTGEKRVFLTFDDGPTKAVTPFVLDTLKKEDVKATFFLLGVNAQYNAELIKREFDEGHYIANHGYSHKYKEVYSSPEATFDEYNKTEQIIRDALGNQNYRSNLFRFPGGSNGGYYNEIKQTAKAYLREQGIVHLDWNALSQDSAGTYTKEQLLQNAIDTIGDKQSVIILMHDSSDKILTSEMLPDLIHYLKEKGYSFKNIYDII
ncbi:MAG: polysaccharide deacetylase family protein [Christensenellales bacterium]